jgi:ribosomal protein S18 acetylase RimI-like enzyme
VIDINEARPGASIGIRAISHTGLDHALPELAVLFREVVNETGTLGFFPTMADDESLNYWLSLRADLREGSRILLAAYDGDRIVGSGQLEFPMWPSAHHRAEIHKVFVAKEMRGRGVGRLIVRALQKEAALHGRTLLLLNARNGGPGERLYLELGFKKVGVIPGYAAGLNGDRFDSGLFYQELA